MSKITPLAGWGTNEQPQGLETPHTHTHALPPHTQLFSGSVKPQFLCGQIDSFVLHRRNVLLNLSGCLLNVFYYFFLQAFVSIVSVLNVSALI